ncbi:MAG TPA: zinc-binding dehydrogenase [Leptolyngbyaceae cyanobacterium M65_K2018_010]|nr:zinc-binding dehydrogenase [Leptolyngbyaceae cyanobacterium M65_K2018_010]
MPTYRRVVITQHGSPEVLQLVEEAELPYPGPDQVLLRVLAVGAAYTDVLIREGMYPGIPKPPFSPGYEVVGIIEQLGEQVTGLALGQRVVALTVTGGYSEYLCVAAQELVPVPDGVDANEAACLALQYVTAYQLIHRVAHLRAGQRVLIHGAGGGVGTALLEIGQILGLDRYGTASTAKQALVQQLGARPIDYQQEDFVQRVRELTGKGVDAVFDGIGGGHLWQSYRALAKGGQLVCYGFSAALRSGQRQWVFLATFALMALLKLWPDGKQVWFYSITGLKQQHPDWFKQDLGMLLDWLAAGRIRPVIAQRLPLQEAMTAHRLLDQGAVPGQLVLVCTGEGAKPCPSKPSK